MVVPLLSMGEIERAIGSEVVASIPSLFGRLFHLSSLRNVYTGDYEHSAMSRTFGPDSVDTALRLWHKGTFTAWLAYQLAQQESDLRVFLTTAPHDATMILEAWAH